MLVISLLCSQLYGSLGNRNLAKEELGMRKGKVFHSPSPHFSLSRPQTPTEERLLVEVVL